jgi:transcriptional regulator with XRE-family HTH domain
MSFAERLKLCRELKGISQTKVASENGISRRAYQYYEAGRQEPTVDVAIALADYFNVSLDYLVGRTGEALAMTASEWLGIARPDAKQGLYDEVKKVFSAPAFAASLLEEARKVSAEMGEEPAEDDDADLPADVVGEIATGLLAEWIEEKRPEALEVIDTLIEKIEVVPPDRINVFFRIRKKRC